MLVGFTCRAHLNLISFYILQYFFHKIYREEAHVQEMFKWIQGEVKNAHEYHVVDVIRKSTTRIDLHYYN